MGEQNGFWSNSWPFITVLAIVILGAIVIVDLADNSAPLVNDSTPEVSEIRGPESFGAAISVTRDSGGFVTILFEAGLFEVQNLVENVPYKIIWEES